MQKLSYSKYQPNEFDLYFSVVSEDEVMKYVSGKGLSKTQAEEKFQKLLELNIGEHSYGYFKILWNNQHIGSAKLEPYRKDTSVWELGYILKKDFWRKGFATQICQLMIELAKEINSSMDIIGIIDPENEGSRKVLEKFRFQTYFIGEEDGMLTEKLKLKAN